VRTVADLPVYENFELETLCGIPDWAGISAGQWAAVEPFGSVLVWRYPQAAAALRQPELGAPDVVETSIGAVTGGPGFDWAAQSSTFLNGVEHRRTRAATAPAFSPAAVEGLRPMVAEVATEMVASIPAGEVDLATVSSAYPMAVFGRLLGAEPAQIEAIAPHVTAMTYLFSYGAGEWQDRIDAAVPEMYRLADDLRRCPVGIVDRIEQLDLDDPAKRHLVTQLLIAGWETTGAQIGGLLYAATGTAVRWESFRTHVADGHAAAVVTETARWQPATPGVVRIALSDTVVGDIAVPAGTRVIPAILWASRDPETFDRPDEWDPSRYLGPDPAPAPLTFGGGTHRCVGERLAVMELEELAKALDAVGPADGWELLEEPEWTMKNQPRRPLSLVSRGR
jgi:cytochrome P450